MDLKQVEKELNKFAKYVIQQSRSRLTRFKKNSSKSLYDSITFYPKEKTLPTLSFEFEDYGMFQDKGVRGAGGVRKTTSVFNPRNNKGKMWKQKGGNSPFSFKEGKKPSVKHFKDWAKTKGLNAFAVREAVYRQGIKPSLFFTVPFQRAFKNLPPEIAKAFGEDLGGLFNDMNK